jgi:co-chaperonin GroES (HSP10)
MQTYTTSDGKSITVIGPWLLVKPAPWADKTEGGLFLTPGAQDQHNALNHGEVVAVGTFPNKKGGGNYPIPGIKTGDHVLFIKFYEKQHTNEKLVEEFEGVIRLGPTDILLVADSPEDFASCVK